MSNKKYCPIHCFNYSGHKCPICEQERVDRMVFRFANPIMAKEIEKEGKKITQEALNNLLAKFNSK